jgi:hypothetical protein
LCLHRDAKTKLKFSHEGEGFSTFAQRGNNPEPIVGYGRNVNNRMSLPKSLKMIMLKRLRKKEYGGVVFFERMHE